MMRRTSTLLAFGVVLAFVLGACSRSTGAAHEKDPVARLLAHTDRMIEILRDNQEDPEKAIKELTAYQEENNAEMERLKQAMSDFMQKDPMKAAAVSSAYGFKSAELASRTEELAAKMKARAR